tara:strand:- start:122 stop:553 length:432 start_codon:yes stop_codon:yes gene_type:complete
MTDIKIKQLDPLSKRLSDAGFTGGASKSMVSRLKNYKIDFSHSSAKIGSYGKKVGQTTSGGLNTATVKAKNLTEAKNLIKDTKTFKKSFDDVNKRKKSSDPNPRLVVKRVYENNKLIKGKPPRKSILEKSKGGSLVSSLYKGF